MNNFKELIIVIGLLTVMAVMGAKVIRLGSPEWRKTVCRNNLIELYKLHVSYQNDNNGIIAPRIDRTKKTRWKYWPQYISKYGKDSMVFYCPANHKAENMFNSDPLEPKVFSLKSVSYGMNYVLGNYKEYKSPQTSRLIRLKQALNPSYMIFLGDAKTMSLRPTKWCWKSDYAPLHYGKSNFITLAGGVKRLGKPELGLASCGGKKTWDGWRLDAKRWKNIK